MRMLPPIAMGRLPVMLTIVDDAHPDAESLRTAALALPFERLQGDFYPGVRAPAPAGYAQWLREAAWTAGLARDLDVLRTTFAIAVDAPAALAPIQRVPHFDTVDPDVVAAVHYLCDPPHGGTSFYRHRRTGYERIDASRGGAWRQILLRDASIDGLPAVARVETASAAFERIGRADLRFNRVIFYPANCLHAGDLAGGVLDPSPDRGRLTLTSLIGPRSGSD